MKRIALRFLALTSALCVCVVCLRAATSPRYGGTLRIELRQNALNFDPRTWKTGTAESAANEKLAALVFDRLAVLDRYGHLQPQLATEWSHDASFKRWRFTIRAGVKFSDGAPLTAADVSSVLQPFLTSGEQVSSSANIVVVQSAQPMPDLLERLASGRFFVYREQNGSLLGTGPFYVSENMAPALNGKILQYKLNANENCWAGRPFVDAIDLTLDIPSLRALFDLQLGRADLIEISLDLVRRASQENLHIWRSAPVCLFGLRFDETQAAVRDPKLREAISLSLDRGTMASVLLQKQAEPAAALLPQWLSGYAFLFNVETNLTRAKEMRAALIADSAGGVMPLRLRVDASGDLAKLLGERVAVNARQAGIPIQVANRSALRTAATASAEAADSTLSLHLFEWHYTSLSARAELESLAALATAGVPPSDAASASTPEQLYAAEKRILDDRRILPLVALPEFVGVGKEVRDWLPSRWGDWHLADVWLDRPNTSTENNSSPDAAQSATPAASPISAQGATR